MGLHQQEKVLEPMSPTAQYLRSSALSLTILAVLESEVPVDDSVITVSQLRDIFLPINPRFSSIVFTDEKGEMKWKRVEVDLEDHVYVPIFPSDMPIEYYDECFTEYLSKIAMEELPHNRPLWEVHRVKYPTKNAAGNVIFKFHHSLGDGYSLMGALLSCLQRADNPLMPLTFPSRQSNVRRNPRSNAIFRRVPRFFTRLAHTAYDFGRSLIKSTLIEDDKSPIRSGEDGVEFKPIITTTTTFSIDQLKQIKSSLNVTINDVITGIIIFAIRLYMQETSPESEVAKSTILVLLNTRAPEGYKSVNEMMKPNSKMPWGNHFAFLHVTMPKLKEVDLQNPLTFIKNIHQMIERQRNSGAPYLTGQFLNFIRKIKGHEAAARFIQKTIKNASLGISNMIGPVEKMALADRPFRGLYFVMAGVPQNLSITMVSYVGNLRVAITVEKGFIDPNKLKSCIECAFWVIFKAALESPTIS